jgi:hypothetical protein
MTEEDIRGYELFALRQALIAGEASGDYAPFDFEAFIAERRNEPSPAWRERVANASEPGEGERSE